MSGQDAIAVITGAASGIGRTTAVRLAGEGARVVLIDMDAGKLPAAEAEVMAASPGDKAGRVMSFHLDVSDRVAMQQMADRVLRTFGAPTFLMNNAAIYVHGGPGGLLDPLDNWRRVFEINFFGILNGVSAFLPDMLKAERAARIVVTGSKQGITHPPGTPAYNVVKAAVNAYAMNLARDLRTRKEGKVSAHLLVPGWTTTGNNEHRPGAWRPDQVVDYMFDRLEKDDFYIVCPDDETDTATDNKRIAWQAFDMIENRPALSRWHPDYAEAFAEFMKKDLE